MKTEQEYKAMIKESFKIDESSIIDYELTNILYKNKTKACEAIRLGIECIENYPDNEFFWKFLGFSYNLNDEFKKSLDCAFKRISLDPDNHYNWIDLSFAYRSYGEVIISDWMNFNIELFMDYYKKLDIKELNHENLIRIINKIKERL